jgi:uncharacterized protein (DUF924 family)
MLPVQARAVLDFWFGAPTDTHYGQTRSLWFAKSEETDTAIRGAFGALHAQAAQGLCDDWAQIPAGTLALIIVLDQFSRNLYRDQPHAFACDTQALRWARHMVGLGQDQTLLPVQRSFVYLPFEHSENLQDQRESLRLFARLADEPKFSDGLVWAQKHYDIVARFGRFPHRNAALGRADTPEETAFLKQPGSRF